MGNAALLKKELGDAEDRSKGLDRALEAIRKHLGMDVAYLSEFVGNDSVFRAVDAPGLEELAYVGRKLSLDDVYCRHIIEGRLPELIPDTGANAFAAALPITGAVPIGSHMSLPIRRSNGSLYGMFCCLSAKPNPSLNERDLNVMRMYADLVNDFVQGDLERDSDQREKRARIEEVLETQALKPVYQPIWDMVSGAPIGFEALCRFDGEPYRSPDLWFNEAAEVGLALELELAALAKALEGSADLPDHCYLSVNVSPQTAMSPRLAEVIEAHAKGRLLLEITEHAPVEDYQALHDALAPLRARGIQLAVDDAGAGYSSLQHIIRLHPDVIKLDMSLTRDIDTDQALRSMAVALIHFSRQTGAKIIAEGIETEGEKEMLSTLGVSAGQGYYLGRPVSFDEALALLADTASQTTHAA
jgi:EAL domain-containing protein (putative c-di-GMP-specific phosphodiesterase class I)